jgi:hypothetical protein
MLGTTHPMTLSRPGTPKSLSYVMFYRNGIRFFPHLCALHFKQTGLQTSLLNKSVSVCPMNVCYLLEHYDSTIMFFGIAY